MKKQSKFKAVTIRDYKVQDDLLLIKKNGSFPRRCVLTNEPAKAKDKVKYVFTEKEHLFDGKTSPAARLLGVSLIAAGVNSRSLNSSEVVHFSYYLSKKYRMKRNLIKFTMIALLLSSIFYSLKFMLQESVPWYTVLTVISALAAYHFYKVCDHPIKKIAYEKGFYQIKGFCEEFRKDIEEELSEKTVGKDE